MSNARKIFSEILIWLPVGIVPIFNGVIRMVTYGKVIGDPAASLISSAFDIALVLFYAFFIQNRAPASLPLRRGMFWLAMSTLNHFLLGHFVFNVPWDGLLNKYNIFELQTWGAITAVIALAPLLANFFPTRRRVSAQ